MHPDLLNNLYLQPRNIDTYTESISAFHDIFAVSRWVLKLSVTKYISYYISYKYKTFGAFFVLVTERK